MGSRIENARGKVVSRMGIIIIAAVILEIISLVGFIHMRRLLLYEIEGQTQISLRIGTSYIQNTLSSSESVMQEHLWDIRRCLSDPDSVMAATGRLIAANPDVVGASIGFVPDFYPSKGRLFEPYAYKEGGSVVLQQLGSEGHDYTLNPIWQDAIRSGIPVWSDPYLYGDSPQRRLSTYSCPITDDRGNTVAVCGLDLDLSQLGQQARQRFPSSFGIMLTADGTLVASQSDSPDVQAVVRLINDSTATRRLSPDGRQSIKDFRSSIKGRKAFVQYAAMERQPHWQIAQANYYDEVYAPLRKLRLRQLVLSLLGALVLLFMIVRFARNEARLRKAQLEQARLGGELTIARRIQTEMLPTAFHACKGMDLCGSLLPANEVGGDLFDYFLRDGRLFFCIGDVSGKGVPSAMLMSMTHSLVRMISATEDSPSRMIAALNSQLCRNNDSNMFITFFLGVLDLPSGLLRYCNAGHDRPILLTDKAAELPALANLPLGTFEDTVFTEQTCLLDAGCTLFLYTDGLTEQRAQGKEQFTREGVKRVLGQCRGMDARQIVERMNGAVKEFACGAPPRDDQTLLAVRYTGQSCISLGCDVQEVSRLGEFVKGFTSGLQIDGKTAARMRLALEEIVVNVMSYAYPGGGDGRLEVRAWEEDGCICFTVADSGVEFDPTAAITADTTLDAVRRPLGGLGIFLARELMDEVRYVRTDTKNVLILKKRYHENQHSGN